MALLGYQIILGIIATIIGFASFVPYFIDIFKREVKPHAFTWLIWAILNLIAFSASAARGGGAGTWLLGVNGIVFAIIGIISIFWGEKEITGLDKASLAVAIIGIGLWVVTTNPLWSVLLAAGIDAVGFIPTFRKAYKRPHQEAALIFILGGISFFVSILALQSVSITTVVYPAMAVVTNSLFVGMLLLRRRQLNHNSSKRNPK